MPATLFEAIRFLHSILLFIKKRKRLMVCSAFPARSAGRSGTATCAKKNKCGTHRLDHLCAPLFVAPRLSLWESWREAPERARTLTKNGRRSDNRALTKTQLIAAQRFFPLWLALSVIAPQCHLSQRERHNVGDDRWEELSLDTPGECTIIRCVGKTRKVVFLRNDKMGGNE